MTTYKDLQTNILANPEACTVSNDASDQAQTLAGIYDTLVHYELAEKHRGLILGVFKYKSMLTQRSINKGTYTLTEAVFKGSAYLDLASSGYEVTMIMHELNKILNAVSPFGYRFGAYGGKVGWFEDMEPVNMFHVRTYMHNQVPSKAYNKATPKDALYLLDTLIAWKDKSIPVPQKYIDCMQDVVNSHGVGDGL